MEEPTTLAAAAWLGLALACSATAQTPGIVEQKGQHFRLAFHHGDLEPALATRLAGEARDELERLADLIEQTTGATTSSIPSLHLYRSAQDFATAARAESPLRFSALREPTDPVQVWCDYNGFVGTDGCGHLLLAPLLEPRYLDEIGLPPAVRNAMFRVGAELAFASIVRESAAHGFLVQLLAMGTAEHATNPALEYGVDASFDRRRETVVGRRGFGHEFTLSRTLRVGLDWQTAGHRAGELIDLALLAQHLRTTNENWARRLVAWKPARTDVGELAQRRAAIAAVIEEDWQDSGRQFAQMVDSLAPEWSVFRDVWIPGERAVLVGTETLDAAIVKARPHVPGEYAVSARIELGAGNRGPLMIRLGYERATVMAWIAAGAAGFTAYETNPPGWREKARGEAATEVGKPFDARVEARAGEVRILIDGKLICSWRHPHQKPEGKAEVAVNNRLVWLEGLRLEPLGGDKRP